MSFKLLLISMLSVFVFANTLQAEPWQSSGDYVWKSIPLRTEAQKKQGYSGGEGFQVVWDIKYDPENAQNIYMSTDTSRVWRSKDGGDNWESISRGIKSVGCLSLLVDRQDPNIVLCAGFKASHGDHIYRTTNGLSKEVIWSKATTTTEADIHTGAGKVSPLTGQNLFAQKEGSDIMFAGVQNGKGVLVSEDKGATWEQIQFIESDISANDIGYVVNMMQNPYNPNVELWVASYSGFFKITEPSLGKYSCEEIKPEDSKLPSKFTGWKRIDDFTSGAKTSLDSMVYASAPASIRVDYDGTAATNYWHTQWNNIRVTAGESYTIEGNIRTDNMDEGEYEYKGACINVEDGTEQWNTYPIKGSTTKTVKGKTVQVFKNVKKVFTATTSSVNVRLRRYPGSPIVGTTWYDDVKLYLTDDEDETNLLVTDKGMEAYSKFSGDTPTAIYFGESANDIFVSSGLHGIYRSEEGGLNFRPINNGLSERLIGRNRLNLIGNIFGGRQLIAGSSKGDELNYIFGSEGCNVDEWCVIDNLTDTNLISDINNVQFSNAHKNHYSAPTGISRGGENMIHPFSGQTLYKSADGGASWSYSGNGYTGGRAGGGWAFGGSDIPRTTVAFLTDFGPVRTEDGGRTWKNLSGHDVSGHISASCGIMDPDDQDNIIASLGNYWNNQPIYKHSVSVEDKKDHWTRLNTGAQRGHKFMELMGDDIYIDNKISAYGSMGDSWSDNDLPWPVVAASQKTGHVYAKSPHVDHGTSTDIYRYQSSQEEHSSNPVESTSWLSYGQLDFDAESVCFAASPLESTSGDYTDDILYVGTLYRGIDTLQSNGSRELYDENNGDFQKDPVGGDYYVSSIAVDPVNPSVVYAGRNMASVGIHATNGIWVSDTDNDVTKWHHIEHNLNESNIWKVKVNPNNDAVYIATDSGLYAMSSLVLNYHFDYEKSTQQTIYNDSIHAITNSLIEKGDATKSTSGSWFVPGQKGSAINLDGTSGSVTLSDYPSALTNISNSFTVEALVWLDDWDARVNGPIIFDRSSSDINNGFYLKAHYNQVKFVVANGLTETAVISSNNTFPENTWQYIAATFDNGIIKIYLNGENVTPGNKYVDAGFSTVSLQSDTDLEIGKGSNTFLDGRIDELRIYNRALSESEIMKRAKNYYGRSKLE